MWCTFKMLRLPVFKSGEAFFFFSPAGQIPVKLGGSCASLSCWIHSVLHLLPSDRWSGGTAAAAALPRRGGCCCCCCDPFEMTSSSSDFPQIDFGFYARVVPFLRVSVFSSHRWASCSVSSCFTQRFFYYSVVCWILFYRIRPFIIYLWTLRWFEILAHSDFQELWCNIKPGKCRIRVILFHLFVVYNGLCSTLVCPHCLYWTVMKNLRRDISFCKMSQSKCWQPGFTKLQREGRRRWERAARDASIRLVLQPKKKKGNGENLHLPSAQLGRHSNGSARSPPLAD